MALEFEAVLYTTADFRKAADDSSGVPPRIEESGSGAIESQFRYRWAKETASRPESSVSSRWPIRFRSESCSSASATGRVSWGSVPSRASPRGTLFPVGTPSPARTGNLESGANIALRIPQASVGERWRVVLALEGNGEDLCPLITEGQLFITPRVYIKLNSGFGLSSKVPDYAPEIGWC